MDYSEIAPRSATAAQLTLADRFLCFVSAKKSTGFQLTL
jgi:hypothetical protein